MEVQQASRFADRVLRLLERVEYRRADSPADKAAIYRLRHDAYMRAGTVEPRPSGMFHDAMDETDNAWLIGVFIDGELASALRLHISASLRVPLPELASFPDLIEPHLAAGRTLIDASRFVSSLEFSQRYSEIPYLTLRPTFLAEEFFAADYVIAGCLAEHQAFYRRMFGAVAWSAPTTISALQAFNGLGGVRMHRSARKDLRAIPILSIDAGRTGPPLPEILQRRRPCP